jgi:hypothetical protein
MQRMSEWRSSFGSTALVAINNFFKGDNELFGTDDKRAEFAKDSLETLSYLYAKTDNATVCIDFLCLIYGMYSLRCTEVPWPLPL